MPMTFEEVRDWALSNGFVAQDNGRLSVPYAGRTIEIEFKQRAIRVTATDGAETHLIVSGHPKNAHLNEFGLLEGLGLSASFLMRMGPQTDRPAPPWMSQAYLDAVGWQGPSAEPSGPAP